MINRNWFVLFAAALALGVGCGDGDDPDVVIESPENNTNFNLADDLDEATPGIQIDVRVSVRSEEEGADVWLFTDATRLEDDPDAEPALVQPLADDGRVTFRVTLAAGVHELLACVRECDHRSQQIRVTVTDSCAGVVFIDPEPRPGDSITLGRDDDVDGDACGAEFATNVRLVTTAPDGTSLQLSVNGTPGPTTVSASGQARFDGVVLGNRGGTPNSLAVTVTDSVGASCTQSFPNDVFVDCDGTSCAITVPDTDRTVLNSTDDVSEESGFQADFEVAADLEASGERVNLVVDGTILTTDSVTSGGAAVAQFSAIDLSEGRHSVVAECFDSLGNITRTAPAEWVVDTVGCNLTVDEPIADTLFVDEDDLDAVREGIQVTASGTFSGVECTGVTAGPCGGAGEDLTISGSNFSGPTTLASTPSQELCVVVTDAAGNETEARVPLRVRTDAPQLEIITPATGTQFNELGADGFIADLDPASDDCDIAVTVYCTEPGEEVELRVDLTDELLGTANCVATTDLPAPFTGQADFASVAVPTLDDGSSLNMFARMEVERVVGTSVPVELVPDCAEPDMSFLVPVCGSVLRPSEDDQDPATSGFQYEVQVLNPIVNNVDLTRLEVTDSGGGTVVSQMSSFRRGGGQSIIFSVDFGAGGSLSMQACATDPVGNTGCSPACPLTILELPQLSITAPAAGSGLSMADDCDPGRAGLQIAVRAVTDAADSAPVSITVGAMAPVAASISGGVINACVDADEGDDVPITVAITVADGTASATVTVDIDSMPPTDAIGDLSVASFPNRRGGVARLQYTAVGDTDGTTLQRTEIRCSRAPIDDEAAWNAAVVRSSRMPAASPGSIVTADVPGFLIGVQYYCVARSSDAGGGLTPLPSGGSVEVMANFLTQTIELATGRQLGDSMMPIGDVDNDGLPDFIIGGKDRAYVFFGRTSFNSAVPAAPNVTLAGGVGFGGGLFGGVAGVGDFNGDGIRDFVVGSGQENSAYVFFGRASRAQWSATTITVSAAQCPASARALCIRGAVAGDFFGSQVIGVGDFNGDGIDDLAIGAIAADSFKGAQYVLLGSTAYGTSLSANVTSLRGFQVRSTAAPSQQFIGADAVSLGDVTDDGRTDMFLSASGSAGPVPPVTGRLRRLNGRAHSGSAGLDRIEWDGLTELGNGVPSLYAVQLYALGDIDGNGSRDLGAFTVVPNGGYMEVFTGETNFMSGFSFTNDSPDRSDDDFGNRSGHGFSPSHGRVGQIDGQNGPEVLIGSDQNGVGAGDARLWYSPVAGARVRSSADVVFSPALGAGEMTGAFSGGFIGDINGDGHPDIAIGEPMWPTGMDTAATRGRVTLHY